MQKLASQNGHGVDVQPGQNVATQPFVLGDLQLDSGQLVDRLRLEQGHRHHDAAQVQGVGQKLPGHVVQELDVVEYEAGARAKLRDDGRWFTYRASTARFKDNVFCGVQLF